MATSAIKLTAIIETLAEKYKFDKDDAIKILSVQELLPKKLLPKETTSENPWASKKAQELAEQHSIEAKGKGSGKNGKWTLADVEKAMEKPVKTKLLVSPNALSLANEYKLSLVGKKGSGKDGRIILKDVQNWLEDEGEEDSLNISPRALEEATKLGVVKEELSNLHGSGKDGRIILEDIKKYNSSSDHSDDDDDDDDDEK